MAGQVNCDRCGQPVGWLSYTITIWVNDTEAGEATICADCGTFVGNAHIRQPAELGR